MMLKVQGYLPESRWRIFDNIRKMAISDQLTIPASEPMIENDCAVLRPIVAGDQSHRTFTRIICQMNDGSEYSIVFDGVAYICNDDGGTVEKISGS